MSTSQTLAAAKRQAVSNPTGTCNACMRTGLPILPLRQAYGPAPSSLYATTDKNGVKSVPLNANHPRTLREGYLYVLLLGTDGLKTWQGYQVTAAGALRQFPPYEMPRAAPAPLSEQCVAADHDVPASFINIDTRSYTTAWLAFANDPWPKAVLDLYRKNIATYSAGPTTRFKQLDLKVARETPASVEGGFVMTELDLQVDTRVLDYASPALGDFGSVFDFYSRNHRLQALRGFVRTQVQSQKLKQGVLALVLPDPIGIVQEVNKQRLGWAEDLHKWRADPQRSFSLFTSQALLGIKELQKTWASAEAAAEAKAEAERRRDWNENPVLGDKARLPNLDVEAEAGRLEQSKTDDAHADLQKRYDEDDRAAYIAEYQAHFAIHQGLVDSMAKAYEIFWSGDAFQTAAKNDYSATDLTSALSFTRMIGACLAGGPTEEVKPGSDLGPTQRLWKAQLEDGNSLLYQALLTKDQDLLKQLGKQLTSADLGKLYDNIKSFQGTTDGERLMVKPVKEAIGQLLAGATSACNALSQQLLPDILARIGHLHSVALLRHAGQQVTQIIVSLKLGEYFSLLNEILSEGTDELLSEIDKNFRQPAAKKVRAMVLAGGLTIATAKNGQTMLDVVIWSMESAEAMEQRLAQWRAGAGEAATAGMRTLRIGAATLGHGAGRTISLTASAARSFTAGAVRKLRATGRDPLLALGSLWFLQKSLRDNLAALEKSPGKGHNEALAALWSTSVGIMGAGVEAAGITIKALKPALTTTVRSGGQAITVGMGARVMQYGGAVAAVAGIMDSVQYGLAANRVAGQGDQASGRGYQVAAGLSAASAAFGILGALAPTATLIGPLGIALVLGLAAYAVATWAKKAESTPLELWARHSLWGLPKEYRQWTQADQLPTAICALNAAVLGLTAEVGINLRARSRGVPMSVGPGIPVGTDIQWGPCLQFSIQLPGFDPGVSRYGWSLTVYRHNGSQLIASGRNDGVSITLPKPGKGQADYNPATAQPRVEVDSVTHCLNITGSIELNYGHGIQAMELEISYWPDRSDSSGFARVIIKEDKLG